MLKDDFDKIIKNNLESARYSWDKEAMWDDIEKELPEAKRKRRILPIWFFLMGVIALGILWQVYQPIGGSNSNKAELAETISTEKQKVNTSNSNIGLQENTSDQSLNNTKANTLADQTTISTSSSNEQTQGRSDLSSTTSVSHFSNSSSTSRTQNFRDPTSEPLDKELLNPESSKGSAKTTEQIFDESQGLDVMPLIKLTQASKSMDQAFMDDLQSIDRRLLFLSKDDEIQELDFNSSIEPLVNKLSKAKAVQHSLLFSGSVAFNTVGLSSDINQELLDAYETSTKPLESIRLSLDHRMQFASGFFITAGIELERLTEQLDYTETESDKTFSYVDTAGYYISHLGELQYQGRELELNVNRERDLLVYNQYYRVLLPVHLGYSHKLNKLGLSLSAGPVFNAYSSFKGAVINSDLSVDTDYNSSLNNRSLFDSMEFSAGLEYALSRRTALVGSYRFRKSMGDHSIDGVINRSVNSSALRLGLMIKI